MLSRLLLRDFRRLSVTNRLASLALLKAQCRNAAGPKTFVTSSRLLHDEKSKIDTTKVGSFKVDKPMLMIAFTCKKCDTRSSHTMSKQAYTGGTVLITCPSCKSKHLIADHLKIFRDDKVTIEDILRAKGESVSSTTDDLAFEDIPKDLQAVIGHHAKDAPENLKQKLDNETIHSLPTASSSKPDK